MKREPQELELEQDSPGTDVGGLNMRLSVG